MFLVFLDVQTSISIVISTSVWKNAERMVWGTVNSGCTVQHIANGNFAQKRHHHSMVGCGDFLWGPPLRWISTSGMAPSSGVASGLMFLGAHSSGPYQPHCSCSAARLLAGAD